MARAHPQAGLRIAPRSIGELVVGRAEGDLLDLEPLDLGPGALGTAALEAERGPEPGGRDAT